jgi:hypothetical protein
MKCYRQARGGGNQPAEAALDVFCRPAERSVFELQIDRVKAGDSAANVLDVAVAQHPHSRMPTAQQVLVEIEDGDVEDVGELPLECLGIGGDAA